MERAILLKFWYEDKSHIKSGLLRKIMNARN